MQGTMGTIGAIAVIFGQDSQVAAPTIHVVHPLLDAPATTKLSMLARPFS
jgi:hypothetical protein